MTSPLRNFLWGCSWPEPYQYGGVGMGDLHLIVKAGLYSEVIPVRTWNQCASTIGL